MSAVRRTEYAKYLSAETKPSDASTKEQLAQRTFDRADLVADGTLDDQDLQKMAAEVDGGSWESHGALQDFCDGLGLAVTRAALGVEKAPQEQSARVEFLRRANGLFADLRKHDIAPSENIRSESLEQLAGLLEKRPDLRSVLPDWAQAASDTPTSLQAADPKVITETIGYVVDKAILGVQRMVTEDGVRLQARRLSPVHVAELAVRSVGGLAALDKDLVVDRVDDQIQVTYRGKPVASEPVPLSGQEWQRVQLSLLAQAERVSPVLRGSEPEAIYEALFHPIFERLDDDSAYLSPKASRVLRRYLFGTGAVGLQLAQDQDPRIIAEVFDDTPAAKAGIRAGARLLAIDGVSTTGLSGPEIRAKLLDDVGKSVTLSVQQDGATRELTLVRTNVRVPSVQASLDGDIGVIRLRVFNETSEPDVRATLARWYHGPSAPKPKGLILDLRGNPGGPPEFARDVADVFLGATTVALLIGAKGVERYVTLDGDEMAQGVPLAVLARGDTASASEIVATSLQDLGRGVVVGTNTYGKGVAQLVNLAMPNDSLVKVTTDVIFTAGGYSVQSAGINPAVCAPLAQGDTSGLLDRLRRGEGVPSRDKVRELRAAAQSDAKARAGLLEMCPRQFGEHAPPVTERPANWESVWAQTDKDILALAKGVLRDPALYTQLVDRDRVVTAEQARVGVPDNVWARQPVRRFLDTSVNDPSPIAEAEIRLDGETHEYSYRLRRRGAASFEPWASLPKPKLKGVGSQTIVHFEGDAHWIEVDEAIGLLTIATQEDNADGSFLNVQTAP